VTSMTTCDKGLYMRMEGPYPTCVKCPAGTYNPSTGAQDLSGCAACAANTYSTSIGATSSSSCVPCGVLMASAAGATSCSSLLGNIELFAGGYDHGSVRSGDAATSAYFGMTLEVVSDVARGRVFILDYSLDSYSVVTNTIR
jgi:hypothetical protein